MDQYNDRNTRRVCLACGAGTPGTRLLNGFCLVCVYEAQRGVTSRLETLAAQRLEAYGVTAEDQATALAKLRQQWYLAGVRAGLQVSLRLSRASVQTALKVGMSALVDRLRAWGVDAPTGQPVMIEEKPAIRTAPPKPVIRFAPPETAPVPLTLDASDAAAQRQYQMAPRPTRTEDERVVIRFLAVKTGQALFVAWPKLAAQPSAPGREQWN